MREDYVRSVEQAGAIPVVLPPVRPEDVRRDSRPPRRHRAVRRGGRRPRPLRPGPHPKLGRVNRRRDDFELALTREALRRDAPILAICRGQQVLNVATGGTLVQDIPSTIEGAMLHGGTGPRSRRAHRAEVTAGSRLRAILGRDELSVNSIHHQSVDRLGEGARGLRPLPRGRRRGGRRDAGPRASWSACSGTPSRSGTSPIRSSPCSTPTSRPVASPGSGSRRRVRS